MGTLTGESNGQVPVHSTGSTTQQPRLNLCSQRGQRGSSTTPPRAAKGRMGRQKGVKCRPFRVTGGQWRTPENVAWPGRMCSDQGRRADPRRGATPPSTRFSTTEAQFTGAQLGPTAAKGWMTTQRRNAGRNVTRVTFRFVVFVPGRGKQCRHTVLVTAIDPLITDQLSAVGV